MQKKKRSRKNQLDHCMWLLTWSFCPFKRKHYPRTKIYALPNPNITIAVVALWGMESPESHQNLSWPQYFDYYKQLTPLHHPVIRKVFTSTKSAQLELISQISLLLVTETLVFEWSHKDNFSLSMYYTNTNFKLKFEFKIALENTPRTQKTSWKLLEFQKSYSKLLSVFEQLSFLPCSNSSIDWQKAELMAVHLFWNTRPKDRIRFTKISITRFH